MIDIFKRTIVKINKHSFNVLIADIPELRLQGLSGVVSMPESSGMLFILEYKHKPRYWMKDMLFNIDILFIDNNTIVDIIENCSHLRGNKEEMISNVECEMVLEINAGIVKKFGLKVGDNFNWRCWHKFSYYLFKIIIKFNKLMKY